MPRAVEIRNEDRVRRLPWRRLPLQRLLLTCGAVTVVGLLAFWLISRYFSASEDTTWQRIQQTGIWRVGMDPSFPPFELLDGAGNPIGYDVDLAQALAQRWGVQVQIVALGFDGLTDALLAGKVDSIVSALPYDPRLTADLSYSASYFEAGVRLAVVESSPTRGVDDLAGKRLAVEWGSNGDAEGRKLQRADPSIQRLTFPGAPEALAALLTGDADGLLLDGVTLRQMQGNGDALHAVGDALESNPYVIALPIGAHILREEINSGLAEFVTTGFLAELEHRWFTPEDR
ncbi:MAG: hypothetical protein DWI57_01480 [Chloroflexi bacterium]|nr:MAG: hypothetical protein DWI57_01480 [Chloroflexota bacterium]